MTHFFQKRNLIIGLCATLTITGCGRNSRPMTFSGTIEWTEHALGARVPARITSVRADEGQAVQKGDLLATLDRYDQTKRDLERIRTLVKTGGASQQTLEQAELALQDQQVISPVDGIVLTRTHVSGEVVPAGGIIFVIGNRSEIWVRIFIPQNQISQVKQNQAATIRLDGVAQTLKGHVSTIATNAEFTPRNVQTPEERITQTFGVKVQLDERPDFVRPGVAADVTLL